MNRFVYLFPAAALLAGCASETRVVNDHSVASQFSSFTKAGWQVSGSEPDADPRTRQKPVPLNPEQSNAAFGNLKVITSFPGSPGEAQEQRAAAAAAATRPVPRQQPAGVLPLLTGQ